MTHEVNDLQMYVDAAHSARDAFEEDVDKLEAEIKEPMACGHPKACLTAFYLKSDPSRVGEPFCTACEHERLALDKQRKDSEASMFNQLEEMARQSEERTRLAVAAALREAAEQCDRRMKGIMANAQSPDRQDFERCEAWLLVKEDILALIPPADQKALDAHDAEVRLDEFELIVRERPINPSYWDMHHRYELESALKRGSK